MADLTYLASEVSRRRLRLGLSQRALSIKAGLNETAVKAIETGKSRNARSDTVEKLARTLGCTSRDLTDPRAGGITVERPATREQSMQRPLAGEDAGPNNAPVMEIDVYASAGGGAHVEEENAIAEWRFPVDWLRSEIRGPLDALKVITIEGDSMAGTLDPGDKVIVDLSRRTPSPPGLFVLHDGLALVAKRLEHIEGSEPAMVRILSDNQHYRPYERTAGEIHIVGRIMGRWQRL